MRIDILTLFPRMFVGPFEESIIRRAIEGGYVHLNIYNIRDYTHDRHNTVDDYTYGGGSGMVLKPEPIFEAAELIASNQPYEGKSPRIILLTPQGRLFSQKIAAELAKEDNLVIICGHYEGVDERISVYLANDEISIGDYVLTGGEIPATVVLDATIRLIPGVLGAETSTEDESHSHNLLEYPQYTRPPSFRGWQVPEILLSGNHAAISQWRREQSLKRTWMRRPDLINRGQMSQEDQVVIDNLNQDKDS